MATQVSWVLRNLASHFIEYSKINIATELKGNNCSIIENGKSGRRI